MSTLNTTNLKNPSSGSNNIVLDSSGRVLAGTSSARSNYYNTTTLSALLQVEGVSNATRIVSQIHNTADDAGPIHVLGKSRTASAGSNTVVQSGDELGVLSFQGADGSELVEAALIGCYVDGTPGANDMPGRLVFSTTADGASGPTERMRIANNGAISTVVPGGSTLYPAFGCRAWVNFNGTGTVAIRASGNVSSITDNGVGNYTVNFTTAMPDANYTAVSGGSGDGSGGNNARQGPSTSDTRTTSSIQVRTALDNTTLSDWFAVDIAIFR